MGTMADYDYELPPSAIAQTPAPERDHARLLVALNNHSGDCRVSDLPDLLEPDDLLVVNDTKVIPARLRLRKDSGGGAEVLLLEPIGNGEWEALAKPARRLPPGTVLYQGDTPTVEVVGRGGDATMRVRLLTDPAGELALPPYIDHPLPDPDRYQTVYARHPGSVAAPTAGLHLTARLLDACRAKGIDVHTVDLTVGLDTFRPVTVDDPADHHLHSEAYCVPGATWAAVTTSGRRVVAVGTTTVRALEAAAVSGQPSGRTDLFIRRGFEFKVVDVLMTNFHLPRSTLLLLLEAFAGERWRDLYATALARGYRFLSLGDAMLVDRA